MIEEKDFEPILDPFKYWFDAYRDLSSCRQNGMGVGPIPFTAITEYFSIMPIGDSFLDFHYIIRRLDDTFLRLHYEDQKKEMDAAKAKAGGGKGVKANQGNPSKGKRR